MADPKQSRHFSEEFKRQIVELHNAGKPVSEIMSEYDLGRSTVRAGSPGSTRPDPARRPTTGRPSSSGSWSSRRRTSACGWRCDVLKQAALIFAQK